MSPLPPTFGRRNLKPEPSPSPRYALRSSPSRSPGTEPEDSYGRPLFVPTTPRGLLLAAVGVFCWEFALLAVHSSANGIAGAFASSAPVMLTPAPAKAIGGLMAFALTLGLGAAQIAAVYALIGHAMMRWLKLTSIAGYTLSGAGVAYLFLAAWTLDGQHLHLRTSLIELAGGALAAGLYRVGAGLSAAAPGDGLG